MPGCTRVRPGLTLSRSSGPRFSSIRAPFHDTRLQSCDVLPSSFSALKLRRAPRKVAWVLHQPFPVYALIGPASVEELRSSVAALDIELTPQEVRWLESGV